MPNVLVIDDNPAVTHALDVLLSLEEIRTFIAHSPAAGLAVLEHESVDLVIQDMNFATDTTSGDEGEALFGAIRGRRPDMPVILLTAWTHLERAVELIRSGAADYVAKPWDDRKLVATVNNLLSLADARRELSRIRAGTAARQKELAARYDLRGFVFADSATERVVALACQVARSDVPVLITGPNGSGKEKIAEIVQANSSVKDGPFITLDCGALPSELIEAELFGAEAGAYTGATRPRQGKFEAADGGTLFLDEIGNLPPAGQMKLLRVLETGRFERLGSTRERHVSVRVISATNAVLPTLIEAGRFREDLFYRLNTIEIPIPPLTDRPDDILPLAECFLVADKHLAKDARRALKTYPWPGNVRELRNAMERAALLATGSEITADSLGLSMSVPGGARSALRLSEPDRAEIEAAIANAGGIIARAASTLGLSRQSLYRRMEKLGIDRT